jgi:hypothetical protein
LLQTFDKSCEALNKRKPSQSTSAPSRNDLVQQKLHFNGYDMAPKGVSSQEEFDDSVVVVQLFFYINSQTLLH